MHFLAEIICTKQELHLCKFSDTGHFVFHRVTSVSFQYLVLLFALRTLQDDCSTCLLKCVPSFSSTGPKKQYTWLFGLENDSRMSCPSEPP